MTKGLIKSVVLTLSVILILVGIKTCVDVVKHHNNMDDLKGELAKLSKEELCMKYYLLVIENLSEFDQEVHEICE